MTKYYDLGTKLKAIKLRKKGKYSTVVSRILGVSVSQINRWQKQYARHGETGLTNRNRVVSYEKKCRLVKKVLVKGLSCEQVALEEGCGRSSVCRWVSKVLETGSYDTLKPKRYGKTKEKGTTDGVGETPCRECVSACGERPSKKNIRNDTGEKKRGGAAKSREIAKLSDEHPLSVMLPMAGIARSTYYYHLSHPEREKHVEEKNAILKIYEQSGHTYGYRRITMEMRSLGYGTNHKTVRKLMSVLGIRAVQKHRRYRSYRGTVGKVAENVLSRNFASEMPGRKLATDITQINIADKKLYMSAMIDMFNGEVVSYTVSESPNLKLVMSMLYKAAQKNVWGNETVIHSDQGWHYQHYVYTSYLKARNMVQSMSRKGNCLDNAMMESFFGSLKSEFVYLHSFRNKQEFLAKLDRYIKYYNNDRIKLRLGTSPVKFKNLCMR